MPDPTRVPLSVDASVHAVSDSSADPASSDGEPSPLDPRATSEALLFEIRRVIVGQDALLERVLVALLAGGHLLLEGVPGLAKTLTIRTLADVLDASFRRIQFTPDLVPADLIGTRIYRPDQGTFDTELGPVFCNFLLADEINRAPAKVQSALLEVMQERQVTIGQASHPVPRPFLVMATQNPIESEGTYPLPEAQIDRFMMKVVVGYPTPAEEAVVVGRSLRPAAQVRAILDAAALAELQTLTADVYVDRAIVDYAVALTTATRSPERVGLPNLKQFIAYGASPRGSINLIHAARALAVIHGRRYVLPADVTQLAPDVLRHRIVPSFAALADEVSADMILQRVIPAVAVPELAATERDVRRIDWNVTARTTVPHVRVHVPERSLTTWLVLDTSASMWFGTADRRKADVAEGVALAVGHLATQRGNRIAVVTTAGRSDRLLRPTSGRAGLLGLLLLVRRDDDPPEAAGPDASPAGRDATPAAALQAVASAAAPGGLVVIASDFRGPRDWMRSLGAIAQRHQVLAVEIRDPREDDLLDVGELTLIDAETGREVRVDTSSATLRTRFRTAATEERSSLSRELRRLGVHHVVLTTAGSWLRSLAGQLRVLRIAS